MLPAIFTSVPYVLDWIRDTVGNALSTDDFFEVPEMLSFGCDHDYGNPDGIFNGPTTTSTGETGSLLLKYVKRRYQFLHAIRCLLGLILENLIDENST